jgi:hypothetical protein
MYIKGNIENVFNKIFDLFIFYFPYQSGIGIYVSIEWVLFLFVSVLKRHKLSLNTDLFFKHNEKKNNELET